MSFTEFERSIKFITSYVFSIYFSLLVFEGGFHLYFIVFYFNFFIWGVTIVFCKCQEWRIFVKFKKYYPDLYVF